MFQDHFSQTARLYAAHRPHYPAALYEWLAGLCTARRLAWDCATGNGQAALGLAEHFDQVVASDASAAQLAAASPHARVAYSCWPAEAPGLADHSVDLVTVAQAAHWFDLTRFYAQVRRVAKPGALLAVWTYDLFRCEPEIDRIVRAWYGGPLEAYWPAERRYVENGYADLPFPGPRLDVPSFEMTASWGLDQLLGYLQTWSARKVCIDRTGHDPLASVHEELAGAWGDGRRIIVWPMTLLLTRLPSEGTEAREWTHISMSMG